MDQKIAIVGSGISGLGAAWALHPDNEVTVYEASTKIGGHSNTVDIPNRDGVTSVDTGFIVYNEVTYPNLTRLFGLLGVPTEPSDMSFSYSLDRRFEYGASLKGVLARPRNLLDSRFRAMLRDIERFRRTGADLDPRSGESIGDLLSRHDFGPGFAEDYLYPMTGAIWSSGRHQIAGYPAAPILRFMRNHGLIEIVGRPRWRTVTGGSRTYLRLLSSGFAHRIRTGTPVRSVDRESGGVIVHTEHGSDRYDQIVLATHTDQALAILGDDATDEERRHLLAIPYQPNLAVLHSDPDLMPATRRVWSSWNAMASSQCSARIASVTYWMNRLQNLDGRFPLFVSLNPLRAPSRGSVHARFRYDHPLFGRGAPAAQAGMASLQGRRRTWFAGAWMGYGFHEDGLQSGLNVAAALGSPAPWQGTFQPMSSAPPVPAMGDSI